MIALAIAGLLFFILSSLSHGTTAADEATLPTVTVSPISELTGTSGGATIVGSVRSVTQAEILSQSGGTVTAVHASIGSYVGPGFIIAELENASQRASVLQAQGSYEAALAARDATSPTDITTTAKNTYATAYSTLDTLLRTDIDLFFGSIGAQGPQFLLGTTPFTPGYFPTKRAELTEVMNTWRDHLSTVSTSDPMTLLNEADAAVRKATALVNDLAITATRIDTDASAAQLAALSTARAGIANLQASITAAKSAYQGQHTSATAGADASVKIALGSLRAAQAQLEKTFVRAPIGGTVNFMPLHVGDYVTAFAHVATVAQNGTLEIVAFVSESTRVTIAVGTAVTVEDSYHGIITSIAPALDPVTKQIEVHIALKEATKLVNGQSVRIALPSAVATITSTSGPLLLPLTAVKLTPSSRVIFSVGADGRLVAHAVEIGDVRGDKIEVTTPLTGDFVIVTDARGLSEGQKVLVGTSL